MLDCALSATCRCGASTSMHSWVAGAELKRLEYRTTKWDVELSRYLRKLREDKPVVVTGDFNCAREPIDIHNAKRNVKSAGFTPEERESFQKVLPASLGTPVRQ